MKALVVGLGRMGGFHRTALTDLDYEVTTVDPDPRAGADHQRLPGSRRFDVVCVAAPIPHLAEQAAWWAGQCDALLIEKPMAATLDEAVMLARELRAQPTAVGYVERFNPRLRDLRRQIDGQPVLSATFKRWNTRRTQDILLDLRTHDIDLAYHLNVVAPQYSTAAGMPINVRRVTAITENGGLIANLLDHAESPLHAQWRDFLWGGGQYATVTDAVRVLQHFATQEAVAA